MCFIWIAIISGLMMKKLILQEKYIFGVICLLIFFHTFAIAGWFGSTGAEFGVNCTQVSDYNNSYQICPTNGPAMAIFIEIFLFILAVIFCVIFKKRLSSVNRDKFILG